ncbi:MAG: acyl carrier protein [Planctomycetota bacterium]|jgi:acyl carrier protein|nr:acyl carrier protein [Planctomycetota bacterium]
MPSKDDVAAKVREIFMKTLKIGPERLEPQTILKDDLKLDSLDMIEVVYEVEDAFDVQIPEERVSEIRTFQQIVDGLHEALEAKPG